MLLDKKIIFLGRCSWGTAFAREYKGWLIGYKPVNDKKLEKVLAYKTSNLIFALLLKTKDDSVAQLVEQYTFNVWALGSSPSGITKSFRDAKALFISGGFYSLIKSALPAPT